MTAFLPRSWTPQVSSVLPANPTVYRGPGLAVWATGLLLLVITARSLVHVLGPDGGAQSIATIDTSVAGGGNIIGLFGQWGAIQLLLVGTLWALLLRYRGLVPFILCVLLAEPFLRGLAGHLKPIETMGVAPGAALNWVSVPVLLAILYLSLCPTDRTTG
jgi:hypothetical protein